MCNENVKRAIRTNDLRQWQVAREIGISEYTLCVWLRQELTGERLSRIQAAIDRLSKGGTEHENT
jgi:hypothetical protein